PLHAPDHATKDASESGTATRWTWVPEAYAAVQLPRQSASTPRTRPLPVVVIFRFTCAGLVRPEPPSGVGAEVELEEPQPAPRASARDPRISARMPSPPVSGEALTLAQRATSPRNFSPASSRHPRSRSEPIHHRATVLRRRRQRVNATALPASTFRMFPVDLPDTSDA